MFVCMFFYDLFLTLPICSGCNVTDLHSWGGHSDLDQSTFLSCMIIFCVFLIFPMQITGCYLKLDSDCYFLRYFQFIICHSLEIGTGYVDWDQQIRFHQKMETKQISKTLYVWNKNRILDMFRNPIVIIKSYLSTQYILG
jgi:hypothetical protein